MSIANHILYVDENAFEQSNLDDSDQFIVEGAGRLFQIVSVLSPEFDEACRAKYRVLPAVGTLGLTRRGLVLACVLPYVGAEEVAAMAAAATALAASEDAVARRAESSGAVAWLESLARLPDTRRSYVPALSA